MKKRKYIMIIALLALLAVTETFISCERYPAECYDHPHNAYLNVLFDWSKAPEAGPHTMVLVLFPTNGGNSLRYEFYNTREVEQSRISVPIGEYHAVCYNCDSHRLGWSDSSVGAEQYSLFTGRTSLIEPLSASGVRSEKVPTVGNTENEPVVQAPEMIWSDNLMKVKLPEKLKEYSITMQPDTAVTIYDVEISHVPNLQDVSAMSGTITSVAGGYIPHLRKPTDELVTTPFDVKYFVTDSLVTARFCGFGHHSVTPTPRHIVIYTILKDGSQWYTVTNIEEQIKAAGNRRVVRIRLNGLNIPKGYNGGFTPTLETWQTIYFPLKM